MTARFIPPTPNCGHVDGVTFTHDVDRGLWFCPPCLTSLGGLLPRCTRCTGALSIHAQTTRYASHVCFTCKRELAEARRGKS